ncbi:alpha/beta-type small acid-soluble spore protein [Gorillibacterium sp. sgz5001074]|uniref:alpha/beta-type small acid-soluble spore protein n=1 Tax=Gorillibacterium sp. sgz5001074 TaxID=3446695 RepID=UPI003F67CE35
MPRRRSRQYAYPVPPSSIESFKAQVMRNEGYAVDPNQPENVKYEVARTLGVPLRQGDNGHLRTEEAGRIGGQIGGAMVKEMIRLAQQKLVEQRNPSSPGASQPQPPGPNRR